MKTLRRTISDGIQTLYDVDFELGYFEREHVFVYSGTDNSLYETQLTYVWQNDAQIELLVPEEYVLGTVINIRRVVPRDKLYVEFKNSTGITQLSLNEANAQALMLIEEMDDGFKPDGYFEKQDVSFDDLYTVTHLRDGVEPHDAVTVKQVFDIDEGYFGNIVADATEQADRSESEADRAEEAADSVDTNFLVSQDGATGAADIPTGTTAQRPTVPAEGMFRRNSETAAFEGYTGSNWEPIAGGGAGGIAWQDVSDQDITAEAGMGYLQDHSGGSTTILMPAAPEQGDTFKFKDWANEFDNFPLLFDLQGKLVEGSDTFKMNSRGFGGTLVWSGDETVGYSLVAATPLTTIQSKPLLHIQDQKPLGTTGGDAIVGDNSRELNVEVTNQIGGTSLNVVTGEVTIPAGEYYIEALSPVNSTARSTISLQDISGMHLLHGGNAYASADSLLMTGGAVSLTQVTVVKVVTTVTTAKTGTGLGHAGQNPNASYEVYTDLKIWKLDSEKDYPKIYQPVNQVITGTYKTGGVYGGKLVRVSDTTFNVTAVSTTADEDGTPLYINSTTLVDLGTPNINTIFNVFVCLNSDDSYSIEFDTDMNGATLPVAVVKKRWIGFLRTTSAGVLHKFTQVLNRMIFDDQMEQVVIPASMPTSWTLANYGTFVPVGRCAGIWAAGYGTSSGYIMFSYDASSIIQYITCSIAATGQWYPITMPLAAGESIYVKASESGQATTLHAVDMLL